MLLPLKVDAALVVFASVFDIVWALSLAACAAVYCAIQVKRHIGVHGLACVRCGHHHEGSNCPQCGCRDSQFVYPSAGTGLP